MRRDTVGLQVGAVGRRDRSHVAQKWGGVTFAGVGIVVRVPRDTSALRRG